MSHYLIKDGQGTCAAQIEKLIGLRAHDMRLGILVEKPKPFNLHGMMAEIHRALHPTSCTCGKWAALHSSNCPQFLAVT